MKLKEIKEITKEDVSDNDFLEVLRNQAKDIESAKVSQACMDGLELFADGDIVNHPSHYCTGEFECIDVMLETQGKDAVMDFCICNAFKYLYRHNGKNNVEDIRKAKWYIDKYLELVS